MSDRSSDLEAQVALLTESVRALERRVAALERTPAGARRRPAAPAREARTDRAPDGAAAGPIVALGGRTLLVLAGAFVLRALTDAGTLAAPLGIALGLAYAGTWLLLADHAGRRGQPWSAAFHGLSAVAIGFPLLVEAASRFRLLSPAAAAAVLAVLTAGALAVAVRRKLPALAWITALGGLPAAIALMVSSGRIAPPALYLVALGVATLWLGYVLDWRGPRWPVAILADLSVLALAARAIRPDPAEGTTAVLVVAVILLAGYLGSIATRTLVLGRRVVPFEIAQTAAAVAAGLGGAALVAVRTATGGAWLGAVSVAFGAAAYAVAFLFLERARDRRANFHFYASVAIVFVLAGSALALHDAALAAAWSALALVAAALARRVPSRMLAAHAAAYAVAAAGPGGLLALAGAALLGARAPWVHPAPLDLAVLAAVAATAWLGAGAPAPEHPVERIPRLLLVAVAAVGGAGAAAAVVVPLVSGAPLDPGAVASARTAVLSAGVVALAGLGRRRGWTEAAWLVYPGLGAIAVKILLEDLPQSRPATLFVTFAFYGAALVAAPRLRRAHPPHPAPLPPPIAGGQGRI
jgi:hypothetical protein